MRKHSTIQRRNAKPRPDSYQDGVETKARLRANEEETVVLEPRTAEPDGAETAFTVAVVQHCDVPVARAVHERTESDDPMIPLQIGVSCGEIAGFRLGRHAVTVLHGPDDDILALHHAAEVLHGEVPFARRCIDALAGLVIFPGEVALEEITRPAEERSIKLRERREGRVGHLHTVVIRGQYLARRTRRGPDFVPCNPALCQAASESPDHRKREIRALVQIDLADQLLREARARQAFSELHTLVFRTTGRVRHGDSPSWFYRHTLHPGTIPEYGCIEIKSDEDCLNRK